MILPRSSLVKLFVLKNFPSPRFYFSGRVAIYRLACALRHSSTTAIVPEYICNVVQRAFIEAGYNIITYKCDDFFEPDMDHIKHIGNLYPSAILCLAPIYGADGGLSCIASVSIQEWMAKNKIHLILDLCQDFSRAISCKNLNFTNISIVTSFNNKTFPGLMGALVYSSVNDASYRLPSYSENVKLSSMWCINTISNFLNSLLRFKTKSKIEFHRFDYSFCSSYPYTFKHSGAAKIQIAIGLAGKLLIPYYIRKKRSYLAKGLVDIIQTPHFLTASVVMASSVLNRNIIKRPYALHGSHKESLKPSLKTIYFRGYNDLL